MFRTLCGLCSQRPVAVNYKRNEQTYYRKICDTCIRKGKKLKPIPPAWFKGGYRKKAKCDRCGYKGKYPEKQMVVYYLDGNLRNNDWLNLQTICLNCHIELTNDKTPWKPAPLTPDF